MSNFITNDDPLFPILIYIFEADGRYGEPIQINSEAQMHGPGTRLMLNVAADQGREVRMTDPGDVCIFHAIGKQIIFPTKADLKLTGEQNERLKS